QTESAAVAIPAVDAEIETVVASQAQAVRTLDQAHSLQRDGLVEQLHVRLRAQVETQRARSLAGAQGVLPRIGAGKDQQQQQHRFEHQAVLGASASSRNPFAIASASSSLI